MRNKEKINFSMCGQLQAQRSSCGFFREQMYHQHRLLSLLQVKVLGSYRGYHRHRFLSLLQVKALGSYRGYHQHRLLSLLQVKALGSYRGYHRHRLLSMLQGMAMEVLHGTDVSSAQVTVHTTGYGCGGGTWDRCIIATCYCA